MKNVLACQVCTSIPGAVGASESYRWFPNWQSMIGYPLQRLGFLKNENTWLDSGK